MEMWKRERNYLIFYNSNTGKSKLCVLGFRAYHTFKLRVQDMNTILFRVEDIPTCYNYA